LSLVVKGLADFLRTPFKPVPTRSDLMSSQIRVVKKQKADESMRAAVERNTKNEQQRNREIVGVIKSWIQEFKLRNRSGSEVSLARQRG
jgi:hypothetical protein